MLLGLSDSHTVSLGGQPVWFTVCPIDPNLPSLPNPVHYKMSRNHSGMEQILNKFKQKAWVLANLTAGSIKLSASMANIFESSSDSERVASSGSAAKSRSKSPSHHKTKHSSSSPEFLAMLKSEMEGSQTINEAKLAKLHSIMSVLRSSDDPSGKKVPPGNSSGGQSTKKEGKPAFVDIFDSVKRNTTYSSSTKKRRKKSKLSKAMLRVLHEDSPDVSSDSGDNLDEDPPTSSPLNKQSLAWLQSRKSDPYYGSSSSDRPRSDSFQVIPKLRESLNAGKVSRVHVSTYTFDDPDLSPENCMSDEQEERHMTSRGIGGGDHVISVTHEYVRNHGTPTCDDDESHVTSEGSVVPLHYRVIDTKNQAEEASQDSRFLSPVSKHYSVPIEVSVHRINVVDVDKEEEVMDIGRSRSFDTTKSRRAGKRATGRKHDSVLSYSAAYEEEGITDAEGSAISLTKPRSKSLDDIDLKSDGEVLIIRTPISSANHSLDNSPNLQRRVVSGSGPAEVKPVVRPASNLEGGGSVETSSLDFKANRARALSVGVGEEGEKQARRQSRSFHSSRDDLVGADLPQGLAQSWELDHVGVGRGNSFPVSRSLDNLVDSVPKTKSK